MYPSRTIPKKLEGRISEEQYAAALAVYDSIEDEGPRFPDVFNRMLACIINGIPVQDALPYETTPAAIDDVVILNGEMTPKAAFIASKLYAALDREPVISKDAVAAARAAIAEDAQAAHKAYISRRATEGPGKGPAAPTSGISG